MASKMDNLQDLMLALADTTRLRLLAMMRGRELCVCYFTAIIDAPQPTVSRHLAYLRSKGLVEARRDGKWMHYRMSMPKDKGLARVLTQALDAASGDEQVVADAKRLKNACCDPERLIGIADVPVPARVRS